MNELHDQSGGGIRFKSCSVHRFSFRAYLFWNIAGVLICLRQGDGEYNNTGAQSGFLGSEYQFPDYRECLSDSGSYL